MTRSCREHVRRRLPAGDCGDVRQESVLPQPAADLHVVPGGEDDDVEAAIGEGSIQVDADERCLGLVEIDLAWAGLHRLKCHADC